ncbi:MAG: pilus assembly protein, partial [Chloroflexi bacterium]|nr:pilus assembly protein [Chloroflexota bacterium]
MKANHNPPHSRLALLARLSRNFRRLKSRLFPSPERRSAGQGLVEFALVLPFLLLLLLGIIEFSYIFAAYTSLFNAAREGVRYGVVQPKDKEGIVYSAKGKIFLVNPDNADIVVAYDSGPGTTVFTDTDQVEIGESRVVITVTYDLPAITPAIHPLWPTFHVGTQAARTVASLGEIETVLPGGGGGGGGGEGGGGEGGNGPLILDVAADPQMVHSGDAVLFTYTVTNTGDVDLTDVTIVDGFGNIIYVGDLAADTVAIETITENLVATTTNEVAATGTDPEAGTVSASDSITVTVINPALDLT